MPNPIIKVYGTVKARLDQLPVNDGNLIFEGSSQAMYAAGLNGQYILTDGPWGAACCRLVNADGTLAEGAWQSLFPLLSVWLPLAVLC